MLPTLRKVAARSALPVLMVAAASLHVDAQSGRIAGVVRDDTGQPIKGAVVTAENREAASLMGISPDRVIRATFVIGSALAAVGGSLFSMNYGSINFHDGYLAGLKAFTAAVFGGIGSIPGAMLGGILLGVFEGFGAGYISSQWKDVFAFLLLVGVLLFRPSGMLGENVQDKV